MAYEMVMPYHLHMPSYFLETFTEYPEEYSKHCVFYRFIVFVKASQAVLSIIRHTFLLIQHLGKSFE